MHRYQSRPVATLMFLLLMAVPLPISVLAGGLPPSGTQAELSVTALNAEYPGELGFLIEQGVAEPLSLATADFDEDGMPDLVVGYGDGDAGLVAVHRGNVEAVYPKAGQDAGDAFHPEAAVFATPQRADLIGSGDFDADGNYDIVVGTLGETTLRLLRGSGTGSFADAETISLSGELTAMAVGEVNRRDGLADVVVGVDGWGGPHLLVFEWPGGALRGTPERIDVVESPESIDLRLANDDGMVDIVVATSQAGLTVHGRDRRLSWGTSARASVAQPNIEAHPSPDDPSSHAKSAGLDGALPGPSRSVIEMRLNRDALPDHVVLVEESSTPWVLKSLTRATYTVDSTADDADFSTGDGVCDTNDSVGDGPCTLRAAIEQANASAGADAIEFDIAGTGPHTIQPASALPTIADAITIDGFTQPGAAANTISFPGALNTVLMVEIDGSLVPPGANGIDVSGGSSTIRGVAVGGIQFSGSWTGAGIRLTSSGHIVEGCFIGTDPTGTLDRGNHIGILVYHSDNNVIGGSAPAARSLLSGNDTVHGVLLYGFSGTSIGNSIQGNLVGTDITGTSGILGDYSGVGIDVTVYSTGGNTIGGSGAGEGNVISIPTFCSNAVDIYAGPSTIVQGNLIGTNADGSGGIGSACTGVFAYYSNAVNCTVGGTQPGAGNVISGNGDYGVYTRDGGWTVQGNFIGVLADGTTPLGNGKTGVNLTSESDGPIGHLIGGDVAGAGNVIANNGLGFSGAGIMLAYPAAGWPEPTQHSFLGNSIFNNVGLGIDICSTVGCAEGPTPNDPGDPDTGSNNLQNYPVITGISSAGGVIEGTLNSNPNTTFQVEFFANTACDPSGYGEGETFLGADTVTTDASGDATFSSAVMISATIGSHVTATATDPAGNSSEFSACFEFITTADLDITKDDGVSTAIPGGQLTYIVVASNSAGPEAAAGVTVTDSFPADLSCSWTCFAGGGASCTAGPVVGDIDDFADLPVGGTATYTAVCDVAPSTSGTLSNTATVTAPAGVTDPSLANNSATDIDTVLELDLGDAPDPTYPTLHASDGARHVLGGGLYLGATVDADPDGQPTADADGDDTDGTDDEDGVTFTSVAMTGYAATVDVVASAAGLLNAWVDFNADGDWLDAGEQIFTDEPLAAGTNPLVLSVPAAATLGDTFARFRVDTAGGLAPDGLAMDGEVEDEALEIRFSALEVSISGQTTSYSAGDDGAYQSGVPWPEPRFTDHGDGTVTDELTGLMWTQDNVTPGPPACTPGIRKNWYDSLAHVDCLNTNSYLGHTDWRMPNATEIMSLANHEEADQRTWLAGQGFTLSPWYYWWSSTTAAQGLSSTWVLGPDAADGLYQKTNAVGITLWPVRGSSIGSPAPLAQTGQIRCWNSSHSEIPCTGTGQDGDHRAGVEWPSPRFEVAGDCVTDRLTGLMWTKDGNPFGAQTWWDALDSALNLDLCGHDDWRLPSRMEVKKLIHYDRRPGLTPPTMPEWWESQGFVNTTRYQPWSGTSQPTDPHNWAFKMQGRSSKDDPDTFVAWPVRGSLHTADADLSVELTDSPDPIAAGGTLTYTVTASNLGPMTVDQVTVTTTLDGTAVFVGATGTGWTCGEDTGVVTCTYGSLAVESAPPISIEITTPNTPGATLTSSALVDSPYGDPVPDNNAAEVDTEILGADFGDAPDPTYPTLLASDGARHSVGGALFLGATVDSDPDGQPTAGADGDDLDGTDDEDGVAFTSALRLGLDASVSVEASTAGLLNAWVDFNADGDWDDPGEQIFTDTPLTAGTNNLSAAVPIDATLDATFARFRVDSTGGLTPTGAADDGEVEDYALTIEPSAELGVNIGDSPDPVRQGRRLTYSVAVDNNGGLDATGVVLTDTLDGNVSFVSASLPACSETGGVVTCTLDTLSAGTSAMVFIEVDVNATFTGTLTNTAAVALNEEDPVPANNTDTETTVAVAPGPHIFSDGSETGNTTRWSSTVGN